MMLRWLAALLAPIGNGVGFGIGVGMIVACSVVLLMVWDSPDSEAPRHVPASCRTVSV